VLALTAASCSGGDKEVIDTQPPCGVEIDETIPAAGATNFYYRGEIEFYRASGFRGSRE
jgi:hypothetical protein